MRPPRNDPPRSRLLRDRPVTELIDGKLGEIGTRFRRLVYLARSCNEQGMYEHYGLQLDYPAGAVHEALRAAHLAEWAEWIGSMSLQQQFADIGEFLDGLNPKVVVQSWNEAGDPWDFVIPQAAPPAERALFYANFRALLVLLKARG